MKNIDMFCLITSKTNEIVGPFNSIELIEKFVNDTYAPRKIVFANSSATVLEEIYSENVGFSLPTMKEIVKFEYRKITDPVIFAVKQPTLVR